MQGYEYYSSNADYCAASFVLHNVSVSSKSSACEHRYSPGIAQLSRHQCCCAYVVHASDHLHCTCTKQDIDIRCISEINHLQRTNQITVFH